MRVWLILSVCFLALSACSKGSDQGPTGNLNSPDTPAGLTTSDSGRGSKIDIQIDSVRNPFTPFLLQADKPWLAGGYENDYELLPLGFGGVGLPVRQVRDLTLSRCFGGPITIQNNPQGTGGWSNTSDNSFLQIYNDANPFPTLAMDDIERQGGSNPDVARFASKVVQQPGSASTVEFFHWTEDYATVVLEKPKSVAKDCLIYPRIQATHFVNIVSFAQSIAVAFKLNLPNKKSDDDWYKEFGERPLYSVFDPSSKLDPVKVSVRLSQLGASLYAFGLVLGENREALSHALEDQKCDLNNIEGCRKLRKAAMDFYNAHIIKEPIKTLEQLKSLEPNYLGLASIKL